MMIKVWNHVKGAGICTERVACPCIGSIVCVGTLRALHYCTAQQTRYLALLSSCVGGGKSEKSMHMKCSEMRVLRYLTTPATALDIADITDHA